MLDFIIKLVDYPNKIKVLKFLKKNLNNQKLNVIDIGGHKGETIKFFIDNFNINKIFVFEPNKELFKFLQKKFTDKKIMIFNYGVGLNNETRNLNILIDSASSTMNDIDTNTEYYKRKKKFLSFGNKSFFLGVQSVKVVNLSEFILNSEKKIDVLKIDTEGFEFNILKGIQKSDFKKIKFVYLEHHYDLMIKKKYKFADINRLLKQNNFYLMFKLKMKFRKSFEYIYGSK